MKKLVIFLFLIGPLTASFAQNPQVKSGVLMIGLVVSDIDASEKFYTEVLGMVPSGEFSLPASWSDQAGMSEGKPFRVKMFKMLTRESATVLKLAYFDEKPDRESIESVNQQSGVNYLTFLYDDLDTVRKKIIAMDIEVIGTVDENLIIIRDPDGIFIELYQPPR